MSSPRRCVPRVKGCMTTVLQVYSYRMAVPYSVGCIVEDVHTMQNHRKYTGTCVWVRHGHRSGVPVLSTWLHIEAGRFMRTRGARVAPHDATHAPTQANAVPLPQVVGATPPQQGHVPNAQDAPQGNRGHRLGVAHSDAFRSPRYVPDMSPICFPAVPGMSPICPRYVFRRQRAVSKENLGAPFGEDPRG